VPSVIVSLSCPSGVILAKYVEGRALISSDARTS
jgi:hypothetical protein